MAPHAGDYLNLVSRLWQKTRIGRIAPTEDDSKKSGTGGARHAEVRPIQTGWGPGRSDPLMHAG